MTFRCLLRNEWEQVEPQFRNGAKEPGRQGAICRLMLDFMPVLCTAVERERDKHTRPEEMFDAVAAIAGALIEEAIEGQTYLQTTGRTQHFDRMLAQIDRVVRPRMAPKSSRLILPEL